MVFKGLVLGEIIYSFDLFIKMKRIVFALILVLIFGFIVFLNVKNEDYIEEVDEKTELSIEEAHWEKVFAKAFEAIDCPEPRDIRSLPDGYYKGSMIDAHTHMQSLPDGAPGQLDEFYLGENIGIKKKVDEWNCMLQVESTNQAWTFFAVWEPITEESIKLVKMTMEKYPGKFVPFIMPPDKEDPTVDAKELERMLNIEPGLFKGYGEIGLYGNSDSPPLAPDSNIMMEIYKVAAKYNLVVYLHLGEGHKEPMIRAIQANPDVTFVFHGDQLIDCAECGGTHKEVAEILESSSNVYYGVDELYGGEWLLQPGRPKEDFISHFRDYDSLLERDLAKFKEFIESHPDQVLWDTDRGVSASWDKDADVAIILNDYSRAFIGKLDLSVQEKFAYKNAEKIFLD